MDYGEKITVGENYVGIVWTKKVWTEKVKYFDSRLTASLKS